MRHIIITAVALAGGAAPALAQQTVEVGSNQNLSEAELTAGFFDDAGVGFTLGPGTTFDINDGGSIGPVDSLFGFSFSGSTVNINDGGRFDSDFLSESRVSDLTLNVRDGGTLGDRFLANASTINITGGMVGTNLTTQLGGTVTIAGGTVGDSFNALSGSTVTITGGTVGVGFDANDGSEVTISGGTVGNAFDANDGSTVTIAGGTVGGFFTVFNGSEVNISGGTVGDNFDAFDGSTVNLLVIGISIDGTDLGLAPGETIEITQRGGALLEATLAEGSFFDLQLNSGFVSGQDEVESGATLTVTRIKSLDFNGDGSVDIADLIGFLNEFFGAQADPALDFNGDGSTDISDLISYINAFSASP